VSPSNRLSRLCRSDLTGLQSLLTICSYWRFGFFFILGALCVGILVPYNDETLLNVLDTQGTTTGAASPYIIAMQNLGVGGLPHLVNALLVTSIFSAGNTYCYMATRSLYSLSLQGQAPKFLRRTSKSGIPWLCFGITMIFPFLSFLQVSANSAQAIKWLINLVTASQVLNYVIMGTTYLFFFRALKAQGIDRRTLPYRGTYSPTTHKMPFTNVNFRLVPAVCEHLRPHLRLHYRRRTGLLRLPSRQLGRRYLLHILYHDLRVHPALRLLEDLQEDKIRQA